MAYFNHAFNKVFVGTEGFTSKAGGKLGTASNILATGEFGFVDPTTWQFQSAAPANCCPLVLVSGSLYQNDKIGPHHGGYTESNKSKIINPKYVNRFYKVEAAAPTRNVIHVGNTLFTDGTATCCKEFLCDETYYLRIDVKGSPALRFLNHQVYQTIEAYTGCCADASVAPTPVDSTLVMITWAEYIVNDPFLSQFILPVITTEAGNLLYAPGTDSAFLASVALALGVTATTWDTYVSPGHTDGECAGITLNAAYVDTKFGDCTFQIRDFYEKEPLKLYASLVDMNGDPCAFEGLCVVTECPGSQVMGLGETTIREVILSEEYRQNFFHSDLRIREITQGNQVFDAIDRTALYDKYYILHSVPRFNNPSSTFDNDQYLLEIVVPAGSNNAAFETFMSDWLENCSQCTGLETISGLTNCDPTIYIPGDTVPPPVIP